MRGDDANSLFKLCYLDDLDGINRLPSQSLLQCSWRVRILYSSETRRVDFRTFVIPE
jgi:hypothetical protein